MRHVGEPLYGWRQRPFVPKGMSYTVDDLRPFDPDGKRVEPKKKNPIGFRPPRVGSNETNFKP